MLLFPLLRLLTYICFELILVPNIKVNFVLLSIGGFDLGVSVFLTRPIHLKLIYFDVWRCLIGLLYSVDVMISIVPISYLHTYFGIYTPTLHRYY